MKEERIMIDTNVTKEDVLLINSRSRNTEIKSKTFTGISSYYGSTSKVETIDTKVSVDEFPKIEKQNDDDPYGAYYLYKYIVLIQLFLYMEAGIVPALLSQFIITFSLTPQYQGLLGAIVYIALSIATPFCAYCYRTQNAKLVLGYSLLANGIALILFMATPISYGIYSTWYLIASRGVVGFTQAFFNVYAPLWVHQYCPLKYRARCMGYLQGSTPLGATVGYFIGSVALWFSHGGGEDGVCYLMLCWRWPLLVPIAAIMPLAFFALKVPKEHVMLRNVHLRTSFMMVEEESVSLLEEQSSITTTKGDVWEELSTLFHTPVYICVVLCLSALFFVVTGIQYWVTLFLSTNTNDSIYVIHLTYLFVAGTGPVAGVMFGGWIIDNTGGYTSSSNKQQQTKALGICTILGIIAVISSIPPSFLTNTYYIAFFLWIMLFTGASILPACSGIVISSVQNPAIRPFATSFAATCYNLLGYAGSNYIPGVIMTVVIKYFPGYCDGLQCLYKLGFRVVLFWSFFALVFISTAWLYSRRDRVVVGAFSRK